MSGGIPPMFQSPLQRPQPKKGTPFSVSVGDVNVPWNVSKTIFRYRAATASEITDVCIFAGDILSPTGASVAIEAWRNGVYGGDIVVSPGANMFQQKIQLARFDLIELRVVSRGDGTPCEVKDLWIMYCA